jgi:hypothetical protein
LIGLRKPFREGEYTLSKLVAKSVAQKQPEQKVRTRTAVKRIPGFAIGAAAMTTLAVLCAAALFSQG